MGTERRESKSENREYCEEEQQAQHKRSKKESNHEASTRQRNIEPPARQGATGLRAGTRQAEAL